MVPSHLQSADGNSSIFFQDAFKIAVQAITSKIVKKLKLPRPNSRKRENGRLLIIAGSDRYFGALVYCIKAASRLVDLIYLLTAPQNQKLVERLKIKTAEFISVKKFTNPKLLSDVDCILIGPGRGVSNKTKMLTSQVLESGKKAVLDADALNVFDEKLKKLLTPKHILTPHRKEFVRLFRLPGQPQHVAAMAKKYHCHIVLKGPVDIVAAPDGKIFYNITGNAGMTKGGTGDVLAGLMAGLYCTNEAEVAAAADTDRRNSFYPTDSSKALILCTGRELNLSCCKNALF